MGKCEKKIKSAEKLQVKRLLYLICNIINDNNSMSTPVITRSDRSESLLACRVPLKNKKSKNNEMITNLYYNNFFSMRVKLIASQQRTVMAYSFSDQLINSSGSERKLFMWYLRFAALLFCHLILWFLFSEESTKKLKFKDIIPFSS